MSDPAARPPRAPRPPADFALREPVRAPPVAAAPHRSPDNWSADRLSVVTIVNSGIAARMTRRARSPRGRAQRRTWTALRKRCERDGDPPQNRQVAANPNAAGIQSSCKSPSSSCTGWREEQRGLPSVGRSARTDPPQQRQRAWERRIPLIASL
jgi:hypothetical protein